MPSIRRMAIIVCAVCGSFGAFPTLSVAQVPDQLKPWLAPQTWEHYLQIYPAVMMVEDVYLMWYASYHHEDRETTEIGFAVSLDGINWHKHPDNPVLRPDPEREWESHYVSSQSVMRLPDGSFRMWYASRKTPPFQNLYFALNTARWTGPDLETP